MLGVFGMLGAGLMVFVLREIVTDEIWVKVSRIVRVAFWGLNIGLAMMVVFSMFRLESCSFAT
jgi:nitric oxide reductase subunit B